MRGFFKGDIMKEEVLFYERGRDSIRGNAILDENGVITSFIGIEDNVDYTEELNRKGIDGGLFKIYKSKTRN